MGWAVVLGAVAVVLALALVLRRRQAAADRAARPLAALDAGDKLPVRPGVEVPEALRQAEIQRRGVEQPQRVSAAHIDLWSAARRTPGLSAAELARQLGLSDRYVAQLADELIRAEWMERHSRGLYAVLRDDPAPADLGLNERRSRDLGCDRDRIADLVN